VILIGTDIAGKLVAYEILRDSRVKPRISLSGENVRK
jgi:hypothetical protein